MKRIGVERWTDHQLVEAYHYDRAPGKHTRSLCRACEGRTSRGGAPCSLCAWSELWVRYGAAKANWMVQVPELVEVTHA